VVAVHGLILEVEAADGSPPDSSALSE